MSASRKALDDFERLSQCSICRRPFENPVSLACGHSFDSLCLRRAFELGGHAFCCPSCRQPAALADIRPNRTLDNLINAYARCRSRVLAALESTSSAPPALASSSSAGDIHAEARGAAPAVHAAANSKRKSSAIGPLDAWAVKNGAHPLAEAADKRPRPTTAVPSPAPPPVIDLEEDDEPAADRAIECDAAAEVEADADSGVECGACGLRIATRAFGEHGGECPSTEAGRAALVARISGGCSGRPPERTWVPMPCFATLGEKQLRKLCRDAQLAASGDKATICSRYRDFVLRCQANGDAARPSPAARIAKEVRQAGRLPPGPRAGVAQVAEAEDAREREERAVRSRPDSDILPAARRARACGRLCGRPLTPGGARRTQEERFQALIAQVRARRPAAGARGPGDGPRHPPPVP